MIAKAGAGPKPVPFKQMTSESLAASITFALKEEVGNAVKKMAGQIAEEDGARATVQDIEHALDMDEMRCQICPERLALWKDKKTGIHLSGMAASTLAEKKLIHPKQLRL
jgi:sterol 3beta-glucosyltransferase